MIFPIAHSGYRVRVRDGLLIDQNGDAAAGLRDWAQHVVWIANDQQMPVQRRPETLAHELWHAWRLEFGKAADDESEANQVANFTLWFWQHLERQGGVAALMRMRPDEVVDHDAGVELPENGRPAQCPKCRGYLELPIETKAPSFENRFGRLIVRRSGRCDHCDHVVSWRESCTTRGVPTGTVIGKPVISLSDPEAAAF